MPKLFKSLENFLQCPDSWDLPSLQTSWPMWLCSLCFRRGLLFWCGHHCWSPSDIGWQVQWRIGSSCQKHHRRNHSGTGQVSATSFYCLLLFFCFRCPSLTTPIWLWLEMFCERFGGLMHLRRYSKNSSTANSLAVNQSLGDIEVESFWHRLISLQMVSICFSSELCLMA